MKDNWEGYIVDTISDDDVDYLVSMIEYDPEENPKYFIIKSITSLCKMTLKQFNDTQHD